MNRGACNNLNDLFARAGTAARLAVALDIHPFTPMYQWKKSGIPVKYWEAIIKHCDVTPAELYAINQRIFRARNVKVK